MAKTTETHFALFRKHCQKFIDQFGLRQYEVTHTHKRDMEAVSNCFVDPESAIVIMNFASDWGMLTPLDEKAIKRAAFHEVMELLLWELRQAMRAFFSEEVVNKKIHAVIRTWENVHLT